MACSPSKPVPNVEGEKLMALFRRRERKRTKSSGTLSSKKRQINESGVSNASLKRLPESFDDFDKEEAQINDPDFHEKRIEEGELVEKNVVSAAAG